MDKDNQYKKMAYRQLDVPTMSEFLAQDPHVAVRKCQVFIGRADQKIQILSAVS
jgi:hypothetical protein